MYILATELLGVSSRDELVEGLAVVLGNSLETTVLGLADINLGGGNLNSLLLLDGVELHCIYIYMGENNTAGIRMVNLFISVMII